MERKTLTLDELKAISLDILRHVDAFCRERDIPYYLAFGTALGAVRHRGFIPWDDDIDLLVPREAYERFVREFSDPTGRYVALSFEKGSFPYPYTKVVDTHTEQQQKNTKPVEGMGVAVDIFPMDTFRETNRERLIRQKKHASRIFHLLRYTRYNRLSEVNEGGFSPLHTALYLWCRLWGTQHYRRKLERAMHRMRGDGPFCGVAADFYTDITHVYDVRLLQSRVLYEFEGERFFSFGDITSYLSTAYGPDYMTPPPPEKRTAHLAVAYYKEEKTDLE